MKAASGNLDRLFDELHTAFNTQFGDSQKAVFAIAPASFVLTGDHTQYNDGLMFTAAVNSYIGIGLKKNVSEKINLVVNGLELQQKQLLDMILKTDDNVMLSLSTLLKVIEKKELLSTGFSCLILNWSSKVFGLGNSAALSVALVSALNEAFGLKLNQKQIVDICIEADTENFGELVNPSLYYSTLGQRSNTIMYFDTRTKYRKYFEFDTGYTLAICNTNQSKENFREICLERIEECKIGAKGLRLYIWGIKNLRDVEEQFLYRHENMIPRRLFVRCLYNVKARKIVELGYRHIKNNNIKDFGKTMSDTHESLLHDYEIVSELCANLVDAAHEIKIAEGSKMLSCSYFEATINLVNKNNFDKFVSSINKKYYELTGKELKTTQYQLCEGVKVAKEKEIVQVRS